MIERSTNKNELVEIILDTMISTDIVYGLQ